MLSAIINKRFLLVFSSDQADYYARAKTSTYCTNKVAEALYIHLFAAMKSHTLISIK